jgi:hypothetical protein
VPPIVLDGSRLSTYDSRRWFATAIEQPLGQNDRADDFAICNPAILEAIIVSLYERTDENSPRGAVFVPFCYYDAAINTLTNSAHDPYGKIPEFKYCAVRLPLAGNKVLA